MSVEDGMYVARVFHILHPSCLQHIRYQSRSLNVLSFPLALKKPFSKADTMLLFHCLCLLPSISTGPPLPTRWDPRISGFHLLVSSKLSTCQHCHSMLMSPNECLVPECTWLFHSFVYTFFFDWVALSVLPHLMDNSRSLQSEHMRDLFCEVHHVLKKNWLFSLLATLYFIFISYV